MTALKDGKLAQALKRRKIVEVVVEGLDMWDKAEMVRGNLATHRKVLDESPFNNQVGWSVSHIWMKPAELSLMNYFLLKHVL